MMCSAVTPNNAVRRFSGAAENLLPKHRGVNETFFQKNARGRKGDLSP
jgi:hypothetical protein